jgi:beta-glucosidase
LLDAGIEPWATLYHWEMPMFLEMTYGGWLHANSADYFAELAGVCFARLGDRVKNWVTINEGHAITHCGYRHGVHAPGRQANPLDETYLCGHNLLRAHAMAVDLYRREFQPMQGGRIGIANNAHWPEPKDDSPAHVAAAQRDFDFMPGWFTDPVVFGDYPESMRTMLGEHLPAFTDQEKAMLKGSIDFLGLNHYHTIQASSPGPEHITKAQYDGPGYLVEEAQVIQINTFGDPWSHGRLTLAPWGFKKLLLECRQRYGDIPFAITENGFGSHPKTFDEAVNDDDRISYLQRYLAACHEAMQEGVDVQAYFVWTFMDNFEWGAGYTCDFGLVHVDFETLERTVKKSGKWYAEVIARNGVMRET